MTKLEPYAAYKDSGFEWLGSIPTHWSVVPSKWLFRLRAERPDSDAVHLMASQKYGVISQAQFMAERDQRVVQTIVGGENMKKICTDDFLIHLRSFQGGIEWSANEGKVSPAYTVLRPNHGVHPPFFYYLLKSAGYIQELRATTNQLRDGQSMNYSQFAMVPLVEVPLEEQVGIAHFLDRETAQIDDLIAKQEHFIELLAEKRQAIITHAVTKGLDPCAPTMPSGLPWLGYIPSHWTDSRLKFAVKRIEQGVSPQADGVRASTDSWGVLKSGCVNGGVFRESENKQLPSDFIVDPAIVVRVGDLLVSRASGSPKLVGSAARIRSLESNLILSDKTFRFVPEPDIDADFLEWFLNSHLYREQVEGSISGAEGLANNISTTALKNIRLPLPPYAEQSRIAGVLRQQTDALARLQGTATKAIDLLRERRAALISAAVTGKVAVSF